MNHALLFSLEFEFKTTYVLGDRRDDGGSTLVNFNVTTRRYIPEGSKLLTLFQSSRTYNKTYYEVYRVALFCESLGILWWSAL
jgi:hypothetical protein